MSDPAPSARVIVARCGKCQADVFAAALTIGDAWWLNDITDRREDGRDILLLESSDHINTHSCQCE